MIANRGEMIIGKYPDNEGGTETTCSKVSFI